MRIHRKPLVPARARGALSVALGLSAALSLAACGSSSTTTTTASGNLAAAAAGGSSGAATAAQKAIAPYLKPPTRINVTGTLRSAPASGKTVVMLTTADPGTTQIAQAVASVAKMVHWNYAAVSYDPSNLATLNAAFDTALAKHADYIVETGITPPPADVAKVKATGAKLALGSVNLSKLTSPIVVDAANSESMATLGAVVGHYFVADSGAKGSALVVNTPTYPILTNFDTSFTKTVKATCPACTVKTQDLSLPQITSGGASSALAAALRTDPSVNYLVYEYAAFATGIVPALSSGGLSNKVKVVGGLSDPEELAYVRTGAEAAWAGFSSPYEGYQIMDGIFRASEGMPVNEAQEGTLPTQLLTKSTIGSSKTWNYPTTFPQQFKTLWHVS